MTMKKLYQGTLLLIASFTLNQSISVAANIYKWVDEQGNVHYSQQKPNNTASEKMKVQNRTPQSSSSYNRPGTDSEKNNTGDKQPPDDKKQGKDKKPETAAEKKRRMAACEQARKQLTTMQSIGRIRSRDKDGNTTYMSQEQKEQRMKKIRESISKTCK